MDRKLCLLLCVVLLVVFVVPCLAYAYDKPHPNYPFNKSPKKYNEDCVGPSAEQIVSSTCSRYKPDSDYIVAHYWTFTTNSSVKKYTIILKDGRCQFVRDYVAPEGKPEVVHFAWYEDTYKQIQLGYLSPKWAYIRGYMLLNDTNLAAKFKSKFNPVQQPK